MYPGTLSEADRAAASPFREAPEEWIPGPLVPPAAARPFTGVTAPVLSPDPARNAVLEAALDAVGGPPGTPGRERLRDVAFTIVKVPPGRGPLAYAGRHEHVQHFSASLLKLALLPASFDLLASVRRLGLPPGARSLKLAEETFRAPIAHAVPAKPKEVWGDSRAVRYAAVLQTRTAGGKAVVDLSDDHRRDLKLIFNSQAQNGSPSRCVRRLGFSYVNGSSAAGGFLDVNTRRGIWMASDFIPDRPGMGWTSFPAPTARGTSSLALTTFAAAGMVAAIARGWFDTTAIDAAQIDAAALNDEMKKIFAGGRGWSWLKDTTAMSFGVAGSKIGHAASVSAKVGLVQSDATVLVRRPDKALFVAVWQNFPDLDDGNSLPVYQVIDAVVRTWP